MPLLDVFFATMWLFLWILWIFLLVRIIMDIFRSHDMGGWGKAGWLAFVILLPFLGVLVYVLARGRKWPGPRAIQGLRKIRQSFSLFRSPGASRSSPGGR